MKFDRQLRPATETSWVVSYDGKTIPRWRTAAVLKIDISPYISEKSSDFYEILYTAADFELIKNEKVALDRLWVRQNVFLVIKVIGIIVLPPSEWQWSNACITKRQRRKIIKVHLLQYFLSRLHTNQPVEYVTALIVHCTQWPCLISRIIILEKLTMKALLLFAGPKVCLKHSCKLLWMKWKSDLKLLLLNVCMMWLIQRCLFMWLCVSPTYPVVRKRQQTAFIFQWKWSVLIRDPLSC